jgi:hypothetical protein
MVEDEVCHVPRSIFVSCEALLGTAVGTLRLPVE